MRRRPPAAVVGPNLRGWIASPATTSSSSRVGARSRQAAGTIGRPQLAVGCIPLVRIAAELANDPAAESVDAVLSRLRQPFAANVFGDPKMLTEQGAAVVAWCKALEARLEKIDFQGASGADAARTVLRNLAAHANAKCDYDTARQLYGAWSVVYDELVANNAIRLSAADQAELDKQLARINRQDPFVLERDRIKPPCEVPPEIRLDGHRAWRATGESCRESIYHSREVRSGNICRHHGNVGELTDDCSRGL